MKRTLVTLVLLMLSAGFTLQASFAQTGPVEITSDRFIINEGASEAAFSGNVVVKQTGLTVYAQKLTVHYGSGGTTDLKDFVATGNVKLVQPEQTATGDRGVYNPKTQIMRLTGNVTVISSAGTVRGPELVVNIRTGVSEFAGKKGTGRVTGIFNAPAGDGG